MTNIPTIEEWRDIKGREGVFQISNFGRIKSLARVMEHGPGHLGKTYKRDRILKPRMSHVNTLCITLTHQKIEWGFTISRMVWTTFIGELPKNHVVKPKDGNPWHLWPDNLYHINKFVNSRNVGVPRYQGSGKGLREIYCVHDVNVVQYTVSGISPPVP